jgi:hypothetical protein
MHPRTFLMVVLLTATSAFSQSLTDFDLRLEAVLSSYGAEAVAGANKQITGTVLMEGEASPQTFNLYLLGQKSRFEIQGPEGTTTVVRRGHRASATRDQRSSRPVRRPLFGSPVNYVPLVILEMVLENPLFERSLVEAPDGTLGLRFAEGFAPGMTEPLNPPPKPILTFWLNASNQISHLAYTDDQGKRERAVYSYRYPERSSDPFLQPDRITFEINGQALCEARTSTVRARVSLPTAAFDFSN